MTTIYKICPAALWREAKRAGVFRGAPVDLGDRLKWEPSRGGALFPHLYGELALAAVTQVDSLPLGPDGIHEFPTLSD